MSTDITNALLERARVRYPALPAPVLRRIASTAAASTAERPLADEDGARLIAGHVTVARLASSHMAGIDREALLTAPPVVDVAEPVEVALAEHLYARLEPEELLVAALRAARALPVKRAAPALNLMPGELRRLEESARAKAGRLTLAFHHELICEPAALSSADNPGAAAAAVRAHLALCRSCQREFDQRLWLVLGLTGTMVRPLPPLHAAAPVRRLSRRPRAGRALPVRARARSRAA